MNSFIGIDDINNDIFAPHSGLFGRGCLDDRQYGSITAPGLFKVPRNAMWLGPSFGPDHLARST